MLRDRHILHGRVFQTSKNKCCLLTSDTCSFVTGFKYNVASKRVTRWGVYAHVATALHHERETFALLSHCYRLIIGLVTY